MQQTWTYAEVVAAVCSVTGVRPDNLSSPRRSKRWCLARQLAWLILYDHTKRSLSDIGRRFQRDHSTVIYGVKRARARLAAGWKEHDAVMALLLDPNRQRRVEAARQRSVQVAVLAEAIQARRRRLDSQKSEVDGTRYVAREWWAENDRRFRDAMLANGARMFRDVVAAS